MFGFGKPKHSELSNPIEVNTLTEHEKQNHDRLRGRVTYILDKHPKARDDKSLFFDLMSSEFGGFTPTTAETLSRHWRYIQRKDEKLRGSQFYDRQKHSKKIARLYAGL